MSRFPIAGPSITQKEIECVTDAVTRCWYDGANEYHDLFERTFADYVGVRHALCLPSGTSALHLSLAALGIGVGDEVIVPEATWIASSAPISYLGATPAFADIDPKTWCLAPSSVKAAITPRTRAIISVDLYGNMAEYDEIIALAEQYGLALVEDAAEAVGATYKGRQAGSLGLLGAFSFHGSKTITTGEGGMLVTNDSSLFDRIRFLSNHGRQRGDNTFQNTEVAFKYKASSMQAALGYAQISRVEEILALKHRAFQWYAERLEGIPGTQINMPGRNVRAAYWLATIVWDERYDFDKEEAAARLGRAGLDTRPFFSPLSSLKAYADLGRENWSLRNPHAYKIGARGINLPSSLNLTEGEVDEICAIIRRVLFAHSG